jgi:hypothetical protein
MASRSSTTGLDQGLTGVRTPRKVTYMNTAETTKCLATDCTAEFFLVEARGATKHLCLEHGAAYMRANGHQNDPTYSVD